MCTYLNKTSSTYYFRRTVPDDLLGYFKTDTGNPRTEWKRSLGTKDRETAKRLLRPHETETDSLIDDARKALGSAPPPHTDLAPSEREREEQAAREALQVRSRARREARAELRTLWRQRRMMTTAELEPEEAAAVDLMRERDAELEELRRAVAVMQSGNAELVSAGPSGQSLSRLFERYAASGTANPKTVKQWRARVADLVAFLGHDDPSRVTRADLNRWVEALTAKGLSKKTLADGYLAAVRVALGVAHDDGTIASNPAAGLRVRAPKAAKLRERDLTDDEAQTILQAALGSQPAKLAEKHKLARRWVPWLLAYTGARVGEITQLRDGDIRQEEGGIWVVHITPEAGSVKTNEARSVPLHPHLIELGITKLAKAGGTKSLFHDGGGNEINPASKIRAADLAKWVRSLGVTAPQPNHGWRHRFKTVARAAGVPEYVADRIQGHAPSHEGRKYGFVPLAVLSEAIGRIPRYAIELPDRMGAVVQQAVRAPQRPLETQS